MLACQGRDMVQWSPLGWARQWVLIHDKTLTIALASKEAAAITLLHSQASIKSAWPNQHYPVVAQPAKDTLFILVALLGKYYLLLLHN